MSGDDSDGPFQLLLILCPGLGCWQVTLSPLGSEKSQQVTNLVSRSGEEALLADPHPLMLLPLGDKFWHPSTIADL
jgi:hypothetical protein